MGEIPVDVLLTNAIDLGIARRGLIPWADVRSTQAIAMVDTGAVHACVPKAVIDRIGISVTDEMMVYLANGESVRVGVSEPIRFELMGRSVSESALVLGDEVLIGQTVLESTDLLADCANRRLVPNPEHPDGPVLKVKECGIQ